MHQQLVLTVLLIALPLNTFAFTEQVSSSEWVNDLSPIDTDFWNYDRAAHLLERAGFGGLPEEIEKLAIMTPREAVRHFVYFGNISNSHLPSFDHSGIHDAGLEPFPASRQATTELAKKTGEALGIKAKPLGNRRLQPIVNKFFYWLRASMLETNRVAYWWANRMLSSTHPLEEKMALFWHGHFAASENKIRDYRKLLNQLNVFYEEGTGNFRSLMIAVAKDPGMLSFLDAGINVRGAPNENFAREIMELFTMGVGQYTENDIREAARAFTGWNYNDLNFVFNENQHDRGVKKFLGQEGDFDGVDIINVILEQPVTANYLAGKIYRYFVRQDLDPKVQEQLGKLLRDGDYEIKPFLEMIFMSRDFYSRPSVGTQIKSPVQLAISTFRKLGSEKVPGIPDFNQITASLGQHLFWPPTVAGWAHGRSWITPGLLLERGNFIRSVLFPEINFVSLDRFNGNFEIRRVADKIAQGYDISAATMPETGQIVSESNMLADRDEDFNTRYGSFRGWQMAIQKVKPIPRHTVEISLSSMIQEAGSENTKQVVDYFIQRFMRVPPNQQRQQQFVEFLNKELGTTNIKRAATYLEAPLRLLLHLIMSEPAYQLG